MLFEALDGGRNPHYLVDDPPDRSRRPVIITRASFHLLPEAFLRDINFILKHFDLWSFQYKWRLGNFNGALFKWNFKNFLSKILPRVSTIPIFSADNGDPWRNPQEFGREDGEKVPIGIAELVRLLAGNVKLRLRYSWMTWHGVNYLGAGPKPSYDFDLSFSDKGSQKWHLIRLFSERLVGKSQPLHTALVILYASGSIIK